MDRENLGPRRTLCEQNSDDLEKTLAVLDEKFGHLLRSP